MQANSTMVAAANVVSRLNIEFSKFRWEKYKKQILPRDNGAPE